MRRIVWALILAAGLLHAEFEDGWELFDTMSDALKGDWVLSGAEHQVGTKSYQHPALEALVGSQTTATEYRLIGRETTLQENLLYNTGKEMVTMYHCKSTACDTLKATHYCTKQNQPEFLANLKESTPERFVFDCDMSTQLCQSDEDHIHRIVLELSQDDQHLKSSYFAWEDGKLKTMHSIYHFDRKAKAAE